MEKDSNLSSPMVMLLNGGNPLATGVGEQFLDTMLSGYPRSKLVRYSIMFQSCPSSLVDWKGSPAYLDGFYSSSIPIYSSLLDWCYHRVKHKHVEKVLDLISRHNVKIIWLILNHPTIIHLAYALISKLRIPYVAAVWDTPEIIVSYRRIDTFTSRVILSEFEQIIKKASDVVTISPQMTEIYHNRFQVNSSTMPYCPPLELWKPDKNYTNFSSDSTHIIFAGSLYARREWYSFLRAVEWHNCNIATRRIDVTCMGNQSRWLKKHQWVNYVGHQSVAQATETVRAADVAYLPYWLDAKHAYFTRTSFPSKLSFYLSAGVPIFYHGPKDSTPTLFLQKYPVGVCCHTHKREDILDALNTVKEREFLSQYPEARQRAFKEVFCATINSEKFLKIIQKNSNTICGPNK